MDSRRLSRLLILGGAVITALAVVWFFVAYAEMMESLSKYGGGNVLGKMTSCLYSNPPLCQGAGFMSDGPTYSPVVFWLGVVALLAGVVMRFALNKSAPTAGAGTASSIPPDGQPATADGRLLSFLPAEKYTRTVYILLLIGAVCTLLVPPLVIVGIVGFVLALLGIFSFKPQLTAQDISHLTTASTIFAVTAVILFLSIGSFLLLVTALAQIVLFYIGFNSFRHGRPIGLANFKDEAEAAFRPKGRTTPDQDVK